MTTLAEYNRRLRTSQARLPGRLPSSRGSIALVVAAFACAVVGPLLDPLAPRYTRLVMPVVAAASGILLVVLLVVVRLRDRPKAPPRWPLAEAQWLLGLSVTLVSLVVPLAVLSVVLARSNPVRESFQVAFLSFGGGFWLVQGAEARRWSSRPLGDWGRRLVLAGVALAAVAATGAVADGLVTRQRYLSRPTCTEVQIKAFDIVGKSNEQIANGLTALAKTPCRPTP